MTTAEKRQLILATSNSPAYIQGMVEKKISEKPLLSLANMDKRGLMKPINFEDLIEGAEFNVK